MYGFLATDGRHWHTMTSGDIAICMEYANTFSVQRVDAWLDAFEAKAKQLGYRDATVPCDCGRVHHAGCGLAKLRDQSPVWPHEGTSLGILQTDRLPSPPNLLAVVPPEHIERHHSQPLPPIPDDAVYTGNVPESDADDLSFPERVDTAA